MLEMKRRRFLQILGAAGVAPAVPALPARAGVAATGTHAQMLWAAMYKNANTGPKVLGMAKTMGISTQATVGVYTKLVQANMLVARAAVNLGRTARSASVLNAAPVAKATRAKSIKVDIVKFLTEDAEHEDHAEYEEGAEVEDIDPS